MSRRIGSAGRGSRSMMTVYLLLSAAVLAALLWGLCAGQYPISPDTVFRVLGVQLTGRSPIELGLDERIVLLTRGPRVLLAALCGGGLALAGAAMQGIFRNPLAAPELLGISSGAGFGGALALVLGFSSGALIGAAFAAGLAALVLVGLVARVGGRSDTTTIVLAGVIIGAFFSALVSMVLLFADPDHSLPAIVFWLMGSFSATTWERLTLAAPAIGAGSVVLWMMRFRINVLSLGEEEAVALGVPVERDRWLIFIAVAVVVGATVAVAGVVGWVALVIPHVARMVVGHDHRRLLPASFLLGAAYLCLIDTAARSATVAELPLGMLTALVGAPFVAFLLRRLHGMERER